MLIQVPQYLLEAGWSRIACTQPRRISATLVASRVADEKESAVGDVVGYAAGFDRRSSAATQITYVTDEFLVRETSLDPMLSKYNVIMIDEAHERSLFTDVLAGLVKKVLKKRPELRIIVSSATTQADSFHSFFNTNTSFDKSKDNAVIVTIPGRMFPVDIYYTDEAVSDYIEGAVDAVFNIHKEGRSGDILVFVTGREQAQSVVSVINMRASDKRLEPIYAVPLYSGLSNDEQMKVFDTPIPGTRKVVVATTIAEASITIDGIVFVVDCGFAKTKYFDPITGIERLLTLPISQSSAIQRAGRAGRTRPGKVLRLYTESSYNAMNVTDIPEICRTNLSSVIMLLKGIGIENILTFSFLDTPSHQAMAQALELLYSLGCLDENGKLTSPLGEAVARFPLDPKLAVMLMNSKRFRCSDEALTIVAMLSVDVICA